MVVMMEKRRKNPNIQFDFRVTDLDDVLAYFPAILQSHSRRVGVCTSILAEERVDELMYMYDFPNPAELLAAAHLGGTCHDIGKLTIPPIGCDRETYMKHPAIGMDILEKHAASFFTTRSQMLLVYDMVRYHHEQADSGGFPYRLEMAALPLISGLCAVANTLDHMMFKKNDVQSAFTAAADYIRGNTGTIFCGSAAACFGHSQSFLLELYTNWNQHLYP